MKNLLIMIAVVTLALYVHMQKKTDDYKVKVKHDTLVQKQTEISNKYKQQAISSRIIVDLQQINLRYNMCKQMNGNDSEICYCDKEKDLSSLTVNYSKEIIKFPKLEEKNKRVNCKLVD